MRFSRDSAAALILALVWFVPSVATSAKPIACNRPASSAIERLPRCATLTKTVPSLGNTVPAANWLLANAMLNRSLVPITSPVIVTLVVPGV